MNKSTTSKSLAPVSFILYAYIFVAACLGHAEVTSNQMGIVIDPRLQAALNAYNTTCKTKLDGEAKKAGTAGPTPQAIQDCASEMYVKQADEKELKASCKTQERDQKDNFDKLQKACGGSGFGGDLTQCGSKILKCQSRTGREDFDSIETMASSVGIPLNLDPAGGLERECPSMTGKDHQERAKEIKGDLQAAQKDLVDSQKDIAKGEKNGKKDLIDIQKRIAELEKSIKENRIRLSKDQADSLLEMTRNLNDKKEQLSKGETTIATLIAKKNAAVNKKRTDLIGVADDLISTQCTMQTNDKMKDFGGASSKASTNALTSRNGAKKAFQQKLIDTCIAQALSKRKEVVDAANAEIDSIEKQIHDAEDRLESARTELAQLDLTSRQATQNGEKAKSDLEADYRNNAYLLQQELLAAQQDFAKEQQASQMAMQMAQQKIMMASNDMLRVGNGPKASVKVSTDEVDGAWKTYGTALQEWSAGACCTNGINSAFCRKIPSDDAIKKSVDDDDGVN